MDPALEAFAVSVLSTAAAEFGDKTQLGLIVLAVSLRRPGSIFLGMIAGFAFVAGLGALAGQALLSVIPLSTLVIASGLVFIAIGFLMLKVDVDTSAPRRRSGNPFQAASLMIVLTELGDKTQIITIALAARFAQPIVVFSGVLVAFAVVDGLSIALAGRLGERLPTDKVKKASAIIFIVLGILTLLGLA